MPDAVPRVLPGVGDGIAVNRLAVHPKGACPSRHGGSVLAKADDPHSQARLARSSGAAAPDDDSRSRGPS